MSEIDKSVFDDWMKHPITLEYMEIWKETDEGIKETMLNPEIITAKNGQLLLIRMAGQREVLNHLLNASYEDIKPSEEVPKTSEEESDPWGI